VEDCGVGVGSVYVALSWRIPNTTMYNTRTTIRVRATRNVMRPNGTPVIKKPRTTPTKADGTESSLPQLGQVRWVSVLIVLTDLQPQSEPKGTLRSTEWCEIGLQSAWHSVVLLHGNRVFRDTSASYHVSEQNSCHGSRAVPCWGFLHIPAKRFNPGFRVDSRMILYHL